MSVTVNESNYTVTINEATQTVQVASPGPAGQGVPTGGSTGQVLAKVDGTNYNTTWSSAGNGTVTSVTPQGDNGSGTAITSSGNIKVAGTAPISTTVVGDTITVTHDNASGAGTSTNYPGAITVNATGHVTGVGSTATPVLPTNNLSDLANAGTARTNLGATTVGANVFTAADAAAARSAIGAGSGTGDLVASNNLSDLDNAGTSRTNLGLGSAATTASTAYATAAQGGKADSALQDVVSDTSPQLGGNLDVQASTITTSTSDGNVVVDPPGSGFLQVEGTTNPGKIRLMCEAGTHGVGLISPAHSANANYDLVLPIATGSANQALKTDGSGNLGWSTLGTAAAAATGDFSPVAGSSSIVTTGTIATGTWNATAIEDTKLDLRVDHGVTFDGQGSVIESAKVVLVPVERAGVIKAATLVGDASGAITITITKYDPAADSTTLGDPAAVGTIALATKIINRDTTLSGWTLAVAEGDILAFTTGGTIATVTRVTCKLKLELA